MSDGDPPPQICAGSRRERSRNGARLPELKSGLQKYIRRGEREGALWCAGELFSFRDAPAAEAPRRIATNFRHRLMIIFLEDVGAFGLWGRVDTLNTRWLRAAAVRDRGNVGGHTGSIGSHEGVEAGYGCSVGGDGAGIGGNVCGVGGDGTGIGGDVGGVGGHDDGNGAPPARGDPVDVGFGRGIIDINRDLVNLQAPRAHPLDEDRSICAGHVKRGVYTSAADTRQRIASNRNLDPAPG